MSKRSCLHRSSQSSTSMHENGPKPPKKVRWMDLEAEDSKKDVAVGHDRGSPELLGEVSAQLANLEIMAEKHKDENFIRMALGLHPTTFIGYPTPVFTVTRNSPVVPMENLNWDHPYEPVGRAVPNISVIFCDACSLPVKILGQPVQCHHKYCLTCLQKNRTCLKCFDPIPTTEKVSKTVACTTSQN